MKKIRILFLFTLFFSGTVTWAQEGAGSSGGGNGGGEDVGFATAYGAVCDWVIAKHFDHTLGNKLHLNDLGIDELQFFYQIQSSLSGQHYSGKIRFRKNSD